MQIDLDIQEREVIKQYAKQMLALFNRELRGGGSRNNLAIDAMSLAFWGRLAEKMDPEAAERPDNKPRHWLGRRTGSGG